MKRRILSLVLVLCIMLSMVPCVSASDGPTEQEVYNSIIAFKSAYPTGTKWDYDSYYEGNGVLRIGEYACGAFATMLSDAAFGDLPATYLYDLGIESVRVGDILVYPTGMYVDHAVVVIEVHSTYVVVAEGNYDGKVKWGRKIYANQIADESCFIITRYPDTPIYYVNGICSSVQLDVTVSPVYAQAGETVTLTITPPEGYIAVLYSCSLEGFEIDPQGGTYTYTMPAEDVSMMIMHEAIPEETDPFDDVSAGTFYYDAVLWAVDTGVTKGTSSTKFSPGEPCTRGQVVTFLWRSAGSPEPESSYNPFMDLKTDAYYYKAVLWAVQKGITKGMTETTFAPDESCTRGQVVTFLYRHAGEPSPAANGCAFTDVTAGAYYYKAMLWAVENEITKGVSSTSFAPDATCTRGHIVTFLYRYAA